MEWTWDSSTASVVSEWIFGKLKCTGLSERTKVQASVGTGTMRVCHLHEPAREEQTRHMQTGLRVLTAEFSVPAHNLNTVQFIFYLEQAVCYLSVHFLFLFQCRDHYLHRICLV